MMKQVTDNKIIVWSATANSSDRLAVINANASRWKEAFLQWIFVVQPMTTSDCASPQIGRWHVVVLPDLVDPPAAGPAWSTLPARVGWGPSDKLTWALRAWCAGTSSFSLAMCPKTALRRREMISHMDGSPVIVVISSLRTNWCHLTFSICLWHFMCKASGVFTSEASMFHVSAAYSKTDVIITPIIKLDSSPGTSML